MLTSDMCPRKSDVFAQEIGQAFPGADAALICTSVDCHCDSAGQSPIGRYVAFLLMLIPFPCHE